MTELNLRRIGGSDVAAILGVSSYSTAFDVWLRIVEGFQPPPSQSMLAGARFERAIGAWYAETMGVEVAWYEQSLEHPDRPWQRLTPDLRIVSLPGHIGDVKRARRAFDRHGHPGTDEIADYELVQLQTYLEGLHSMGHDAEVGHLIVHDLESDELVTWKTMRDPNFGALIVEECERFWRDFVVTRMQPPISGSSTARAWLDSKRPTDTKPTRDALPAEVRLATEFRDLAVAAGQLEARIDTIKNLLRESIGEHRGIRGDFGSISYAAIAAASAPNYEAAAVELALELLRGAGSDRVPDAFLEETAKKRARELAEKHQRISRQAYRRLAPFWRKEKSA